MKDGNLSSTGRTGKGARALVKYYLIYTVLFILTAAAVFVWFYLRRRRFVWQTDGVNQHYYGLVYFSRWGKEVLQQFRETGKLQLPTYTMRMGYGEDLYTTLAYYVLGDPFCLPAVFIPDRFLMLYHDLMLLARFWLAGAAFSAWCFYMKRRSHAGVMAGAFIYIFNGFTMSGMRHHYFLNPFVFFPLLLIGCERYFRKRRPGLFIFMVFICAVSNFYFFYMIALMTVLYTVWRSARLHRNVRGGWPARIREMARDAVAFIWHGLLGTLLSSFVLLPVVLRFLQDPRTADKKIIPLFWPLRFYRNFIDCFLSNGTSALSESWTYMGFGGAALFFVLFILVQRGRHFDLKAAFAGLTCLLLTPLAGFALNGFSYPANRWMWAYALLIAYMAATAIPELTEKVSSVPGAASRDLPSSEEDRGAGQERSAVTFRGRNRQIAAAVVLFAVCIGACAFWEYTFSRSSAQSVILALFGIAAVLLGRIALMEGASEKAGVRVQAVLLVCILLSSVAAGYFDYAPTRSAKVFEYLTRAQIETQTAKDAAAARELIDGKLAAGESAAGASKDGELPSAKSAGGKPSKEGLSESGAKPFYRYTTYNPENNTSLLYGVSNTQYYWSLSNPDVSEFLNETGQLNRMIHLYDTLDDRTFLNEAAGVQYFLGNDRAGLPFGYEKAEGLSYSNDGLWPDLNGLDRFSCEVYENKYALPFGFTTDRWVSRADYEAMDIPQRQQALMQGIVLDRDPGDNFTRLSPGTGKAPAFCDVRVPVKYECEENRVSISGRSFDVQEKGSIVTAHFQGLPDCETGLYIRGLKYEPPKGSQGESRLPILVTGFTGETAGVAKEIGFTTSANPWTTGRRDFLVNLRYREEPLDRIEIKFSEEGTYTFDSIEVVCQPMEEYPAWAESLRETGLKDLDIHETKNSFATEKITGHIDLDSPRILCLQIPRTPGWTAFVDGMPADLLRADTMFSALLLSAGSHDIELRYQTPGLRLGAVISAGTLVILLLFAIIFAIVSAILRALDRRRMAVPLGTFETIDPAEETSGEKEANSRARSLE